MNFLLSQSAMIAIDDGYWKITILLTPEKSFI